MQKKKHRCVWLSHEPWHSRDEMAWSRAGLWRDHLQFQKDTADATAAWIKMGYSAIPCCHFSISEDQSNKPWCLSSSCRRTLGLTRLHCSEVTRLRIVQPMNYLHQMIKCTVDVNLLHRKLSNISHKDTFFFGMTWRSRCTVQNTNMAHDVGPQH